MDTSTSSVQDTSADRQSSLQAGSVQDTSTTELQSMTDKAVQPVQSADASDIQPPNHITKQNKLPLFLFSVFIAVVIAIIFFLST